jgi:hypothetical protein
MRDKAARRQALGAAVAPRCGADYNTRVTRRSGGALSPQGLDGWGDVSSDCHMRLS